MRVVKTVEFDLTQVLEDELTNSQIFELLEEVNEDTWETLAYIFEQTLLLIDKHELGDFVEYFRQPDEVIEKLSTIMGLLKDENEH